MPCPPPPAGIRSWSVACSELCCRKPWPIRFNKPPCYALSANPSFPKLSPLVPIKRRGDTQPLAFIFFTSMCLCLRHVCGQRKRFETTNFINIPVWSEINIQRSDFKHVYMSDKQAAVLTLHCQACGRHSPYFLTPWSRVLHEKPTGFQLVKISPAFYGTRRFSTAITSVRHLSLSWASSI